MKTGKYTCFITIILVVSILVSLSTPVLGAQEQKKEKKQFIALEWLKEELQLWTSPFRIKKKNLLFLGGLALTTGLLFATDSSIAREAHDFTQSNKWVQDSSSKITNVGSTTFNIGLAGTFYLGGLLFKNKRAKETAGLVLKSWLHGFVFSFTMKRVFRRQRPNVSDSAHSWFNKKGGTAIHAFPSGHATAVWSVATVVAGMYKDKPAVPIICYSTAVLVALSRMTENKHWTSDILIGSVLGYSIGRFVLGTRINKKFAVIPVFNSQQSGLNIQFTF